MECKECGAIDVDPSRALSCRKPTPRPKPPTLHERLLHKAGCSGSADNVRYTLDEVTECKECGAIDVDPHWNHPSRRWMTELDDDATT